MGALHGGGQERAGDGADEPAGRGALTIDAVEGFGAHGAALDRLGPHTTSVSCLYVKRLDDIDLGVWRGILERSFRTVKDELDVDGGP